MAGLSSATQEGRWTGSESYSSRWAIGVLRAEPPEGDAESTATPGQNSSPGTSTAGRRWQQLGAVLALEQVKNNVEWMTGSCCLCGLSLATHHLGAVAAWRSPSSVTNGFLFQCFLDPGQLPLTSPLSSLIPPQVSAPS